MVRSIVAKNFAFGLTCLNNCWDDSVGHTGRSMYWLSLLKSATMRQDVPSPFMTGNALELQAEGSNPHGARWPASRALFNSFSYMLLKWWGVSNGFEQNDGVMYLSLFQSEFYGFYIHTIMGFKLFFKDMRVIPHYSFPQFVTFSWRGLYGSILTNPKSSVEVKVKSWRLGFH